MVPAQTVCNRFTKDDVKCGRKVLANWKYIKVMKNYWSWGVVVPTINKFVAFANRGKGAAFAGNSPAFCYCAFYLAVFCV